MVQSNYIVCRCSDPRLEAPEQMLLQTLGVQPGDFDRIVWPGCAGTLPTRLCDDVELLAKAHKPKFVITTAHEDCAGGGLEEGLELSLRMLRSSLDIVVPEPPTIVGLWYEPVPGGSWRWRNVGDVQPLLEALAFGGCQSGNCRDLGFFAAVARANDLGVSEAEEILLVLGDLAASGHLVVDGETVHFPECPSLFFYPRSLT